MGVNQNQDILGCGMESLILLRVHNSNSPWQADIHGIPSVLTAISSSLYHFRLQYQYNHLPVIFFSSLFSWKIQDNPTRECNSLWQLEQTVARRQQPTAITLNFSKCQSLMNVITLIMINLIQMTVLLIMLRVDVVCNQPMKLFNKYLILCIHDAL